MDKALEVTNIKSESTDSKSTDRMEIPTKIQVKNVKQESDRLIQTKINIKTEPQEDKSEFPMIASASYKICPNYDMKIEKDEPMIKVECESLLNELIEDPLDVCDEIKAEGQFSSDLEQDESRINIEPTEEGKDDNLFRTGEDSDSNERSLDELLIRNDSDRSKDKKYVCNECNKIFTGKWHLNRHFRIHTGRKPFTCDVCEKSFNEKGTLNRHMLIHIGDKPYMCDVCKTDFNDKSAFNKHNLIHSGEKPFLCPECNKSFAHKHFLTAHNRIHTGEKPFACNMCNKAFTYKSHLTQHKRTHTGEKPYSCDICKKSFTQKTNLTRQKKKHKN